MTIVDDGPGVPDAVVSGKSANGHRGLADMATEAALCGATLVAGRVTEAGNERRVRLVVVLIAVAG